MERVYYYTARDGAMRVAGITTGRSMAAAIFRITEGMRRPHHIRVELMPDMQCDGNGVSLCGATKGLSDRPLETFGADDNKKKGGNVHGGNGDLRGDGDKEHGGAGGCGAETA